MLSPHVPDLSAMELLLAVADAGSLNAAARVVGVSQQAASQRMRSVEALTGLSLLARSPRGSTLTPVGVVLAQWCARVLETARELDSGVAALRGGQAAGLRVRASLTIAEHLMPGWLVSLQAGAPRGRVELRTENSSEVTRDVLAGEADLGFVETPTLPTRLQRVLVGHDRLVLVVAPDHPWAVRRTPVSAAVLARTPLVARERGSGTRHAYVAALLHTLGPAADVAEPALELDTATAIRAAVLRGVGPAVLSALAVADDVKLGRLRMCPVRDLDLRRPLHAVWVGAARPPVGLARDLVDLAVAAGRAGDRVGRARAG